MGKKTSKKAPSKRAAKRGPRGVNFNTAMEEVRASKPPAEKRKLRVTRMELAEPRRDPATDELLQAAIEVARIKCNEDTTELPGCGRKWCAARARIRLALQSRGVDWRSAPSTT